MGCIPPLARPLEPEGRVTPANEHMRTSTSLAFANIATSTCCVTVPGPQNTKTQKFWPEWHSGTPAKQLDMQQTTRYQESQDSDGEDDSQSLEELGEGDASTDIDPAVDAVTGSPVVLALPAVKTTPPAAATAAGAGTAAPTVITIKATHPAATQPQQPTTPPSQPSPSQLPPTVQVQPPAHQTSQVAAPTPSSQQGSPPPPEPLQSSPPQRQLLPRVLDQELANTAMASVLALEMQQASEQHMTTMHESQLDDLVQRYEQQLANKTRELSVASLKIQRLEQQAVAKAKSTMMTSTPEVKPPHPDEIALLRHEIEEQEHLLAGYQHENLAAARRIKELEQSLKELTTMRLPAVMVHDDMQSSRTHHNHNNREAAARLHEVLALQQQIESLRETSSIRESELKAQIDKLRREKKDLEARKGGVDPAANKEADVLVKQVRAEMETMRAQYQDMISELQSKVKWYAENQELLTRQDTLVHEQQEVISQLEKRLMEAEGPGSKSASQRIQELQSQVAALQQVLRTRGLSPSLAAVIEAAKPRPGETGTVTALQQQVTQLTQKLAEKDEAYELQLRSYQQQYEKLRLQFEERQASLEAQVKGRKKEVQLLAQLSEQRSMYTKQIKELKLKLQQAQALASQAPNARSSGHHVPGGESHVPASLLRAKESEVTRLQQELQRKTKQVAEMHLKLGEAEAKIIQFGRGAGGGTAASIGGGLPVRASPARTSTAMSYWGNPAVHEGGRGAWRMSETMAEVERSQEMATAAVMATLQQQNAGLVAQVSLLQQQLQEARQQALLGSSQSALDRSQVEALRAQEQAAHQEIARWKQRCDVMADELQALRTRSASLETELATLKARSSPSAADFALLEHKLEAMSGEVAARETKWREVLEDTRQLYAMQAELANKKLEAGLATKNMELELLRARVDDVLKSAANWQKAQPA